MTLWKLYLNISVDTYNNNTRLITWKLLLQGMKVRENMHTIYTTIGEEINHNYLIFEIWADRQAPTCVEPLPACKSNYVWNLLACSVNNANDSPGWNSGKTSLDDSSTEFRWFKTRLFFSSSSNSGFSIRPWSLIQLQVNVEMNDIWKFDGNGN